MQSSIQPRSGEGVSQISVRLPVSLHEKVKVAARERGQSVNTFVVMTMRQKAEEAVSQK